MESSKRKTIVRLIFLFLIYSQLTHSQEKSSDENYFSVSPRVGYDLPTYNNDTPYIDYKGGLGLGISVDYYWNWFGIGADFDYIDNRPKSIFKTENPIYSATGILIHDADLALREEPITRTFYGIGPNIQYRTKSRKLTTELNTRIGFSSIKGGRTELTDVVNPNMLNFHAGYDQKNVLSAKGQLRITYNFTKHLGFNLGAYYLAHFETKDLEESSRSATYIPHTSELDVGNNTITQLDRNGPSIRNESLKHDIFTIGGFAGITYKTTKKVNKCKVCGLDHKPHCTASTNCNVTVTAKDKFSHELLHNTEIVIETVGGTAVQTGVTNADGVITFYGLMPDNYVIQGKLNKKNLDQTVLEVTAFTNCIKNGQSIEKEIIYSDQSFVMKGNVIECNSTSPIQWVDILLRDTKTATRKNSRSTASGDFLFHLSQISTYTLKGNKDGYFSNEVEVDTRNYDRNKSLFIDLQMCVDPCGKAIRLQNINFDLASWNILPNSRDELDYLARLMQDNPDIKVEMSSHTDSRGGKMFNLNLSQKRAQSTVDYLVAQGIDENRLKARGAGETELLNNCFDGMGCKEIDHSLNRRTEFKVICN